MAKRYSIKATSDLTGFSIRTLRHYDATGLVKPSHKTHKNYRQYTDEDIAKLQQVITLQYTELSNTQISSILNRKTDLKGFLLIQEKILQERSKHFSDAAQLTTGLINDLTQGEQINWQSQLKIVEILKLPDSQKDHWYQTFLTAAEAAELAEVIKTFPPEYWDKYKLRWSILFEDIRNNLHTNPESWTGMEFAKRWYDLVNEPFEQYPELAKKLFEAFKAGIIEDSELANDPEVLEYMAKAKKKFKLEFSLPPQGEGGRRPEEGMQETPII